MELSSIKDLGIILYIIFKLVSLDDITKGVSVI